MAVDFQWNFLINRFTNISYKPSHLQNKIGACSVQWLAGCVCGLIGSFSRKYLGVIVSHLAVGIIFGRISILSDLELVNVLPLGKYIKVYVYVDCKYS